MDKPTHRQLIGWAIGALLIGFVGFVIGFTGGLFDNMTVLGIGLLIVIAAVGAGGLLLTIDAVLHSRGVVSGSISLLPQVTRKMGEGWKKITTFMNEGR